MTRRCATALVLAGLAPFAPAAPQWKPTQPVQFVVMAGKGGGLDKAVRFLVELIAKQKLAPVPFEVINEPGKSGGEALANLKKRTGDNHVILFTLNSFYTTPLEQPELGVDIASFAPIARLAEDVFLLWVHSDRKDINTIEDFVRAAKGRARPGGRPGTGAGPAPDRVPERHLRAQDQLQGHGRRRRGGQGLADQKVDSTVNNPSEQADFYPKGLTKPIIAFTPAR